MQARDLTDHEMERLLREALVKRDTVRVEELRAEARRRFAGMHGFPSTLMVDVDEGGES